MSNFKKRNKNRATARLLRDYILKCPECGEPGQHWVQNPFSFESNQGFWTCAKFYDPVTGRRIDA